MDFLVDASLPGSTVVVLAAHSHQATDVRDIGMGTVSDEVIAQHARDHHLVILSADLDFGNIQAYPPADYFGIVVVRPPDGAKTAAVLALIESLLLDAEIMGALSGRLAIVEAGRIRVRPPIE